jgi:hypothetical protein
MLLCTSALPCVYIAHDVSRSIVAVYIAHDVSRSIVAKRNTYVRE